MPDCDVCGSYSKKKQKAEIDGAFLTVCKNCAKLGKDNPRFTKPKQYTPKPLFEERGELIDNFAKMIRELRKRRKISQLQLADSIHERLSVVKKIEKGYHSEEKTIDKLERYFDVGLREDGEKVKLNVKKKRNGRLTLGDIAFVRKR